MRLTMKEKVFYGLICNERRVYQYWYTRFLLAGVELERIKRVVRRIRRWSDWCATWSAEGESLAEAADLALKSGNRECARALLHEAVACFHVGQHFFYVDAAQKQRALDRVWALYPEAIALDDSPERPIRAEIQFRGTTIPAYMRLQPEAGRPVVVQINGLDNIKEAEQHHVGRLFYAAGFNTIAFDGPGQGEMLARMAMIPDYHAAVSAVIDWLIAEQGEHIDTTRIGAIGFSMGGYFAPVAAAYDKRIACAAGNGGPADLKFLVPERKANPILMRALSHCAGTATLTEAVAKLGYDVGKAPRLDCPMLILHGGADRLIPDGGAHAARFMTWATGEKELRFFPDGEHVCANHLDEALPLMVDWMKRHLLPKGEIK